MDKEEFMSEEEFYEGFEEHLRKLHSGGWSPDSVPGRNANEEFTKFLDYIKAKAWDEGHRHCFHVEDPKAQKPYNKYRSK